MSVSTTSASASPLPWAQNGAYVLDANGIPVARCELENYGVKWREQHANAALIVKAINQLHSALNSIDSAGPV